MKKTVIASISALALATAGGGYYFLSYAPHQTAVSNFEKAVTVLESNNQGINKLVSDAEKLTKEKAEPLDADTLTQLETAVADTKKEIRQVPKMESDTAKIEKQAEEIAQPVDYSTTETALTEKITAYENSVKQLKQITNPTSAFVEERLKEIDTITGVQSVTESNDPNGKLNKQGGYTASVYFSDNQVTASVEGADLVGKGNDAGGNVEVYKTKEDAEKRNTYLSAFDGNGLLNPGSHYVHGTMVVRTSQHLTASQQNELTNKIYQKLTELK